MKLKRLNSSCSYYESSDSSLESTSSKTKLVSKCVKGEDVESVRSLRAVNLQEEDLSSSRRTVYSERTLSETDIHGNAVS